MANEIPLPPSQGEIKKIQGQIEREIDDLYSLDIGYLDERANRFKKLGHLFDRIGQEEQTLRSLERAEKSEERAQELEEELRSLKKERENNPFPNSS